MNHKEAYQTLELSDNATKEEAKKAFRKLAAKYHPDVNKEPDAEDKFKKINEAYQVIESGKPSGPSAYQDPFNNHTYSQYQGGFDISDLFNKFHHQQSSKRILAEDINLNITISFKESVLGCKKPLKYNRNIMCQECEGSGRKKLHNGCTKCNGSGTFIRQMGNVIMQQTCPDCLGRNKVETCANCTSQGFVSTETSIEVTVPAGIKTSNILRLNGIGNFAGVIFNSEQYSNVNLHITVTPQAGLSLDSNDVVTVINLSLVEALVGTKLTVPTIDGDKEIEIPKLTKNKEEVILSNLGVNRLGKERVIINVNYPDNVDTLIDFLNKEK